MACVAVGSAPVPNAGTGVSQLASTAGTGVSPSAAASLKVVSTGSASEKSPATVSTAAVAKKDAEADADANKSKAAGSPSEDADEDAENNDEDDSAKKAKTPEKAPVRKSAWIATPEKSATETVVKPTRQTALSFDATPNNTTHPAASKAIATASSTSKALAAAPAVTAIAKTSQTRGQKIANAASKP